MNGLSPLICRSDPAGSGGAGCAGGGKLKVVRARTTALEGPASRWPASTPAQPATTATDPVTRNARRPGRDAGSTGRGGVPAAVAAVQDPPASWAPPATAAGTAAPGGGAESARSVAEAALTSRYMVYAPAAAPARTGRASIALESGRVSAAASPMSVNTPSPARPRASRRRAATP